MVANRPNNRTLGVDINRNFDINFGGEGSSSDGNNETYRGAMILPFGHFGHFGHFNN